MIWPYHNLFFFFLPIHLLVNILISKMDATDLFPFIYLLMHPVLV